MTDPPDRAVEIAAATHPDLDLTQVDTTAGGELVPLPRAEQTTEDTRRSDVDRWGRSEHFRAAHPTGLRPDLHVLVPRRVGRLRAPARRGRRAARLEPRGRDPVRRAVDHARHREGSRPPGVRPRREPVPQDARRRHALVAQRRRRRAPRQRVPPPARRKPARARVPRRHEGQPASTTASATSCGASAAAASSRSRCAPAYR